MISISLKNATDDVVHHMPPKISHRFLHHMTYDSERPQPDSRYQQVGYGVLLPILLLTEHVPARAKG